MNILYTEFYFAVIKLELVTSATNLNLSCDWACFHVMAHADSLLTGPKKSNLASWGCERIIHFFPER